MNVLVLGTSVIDLFLTINDKHYTSHNTHVSFSLGDKIPVRTQKLAVGGNGANVAVGLARLEIPSILYTYLGDDILSSEIRQTLTHEGVELFGDAAQGENSPLHFIFNFKGDRIIFSDYTVKNYTFSYPYPLMPSFAYLTSVGKEWENAYSGFLDFVLKNNIPYAFSPGSRQLENINQVFMKALKNSSLLCMNKEEVMLVVKALGKDTDDIQKMLRALASYGPKLISVTDGKHGAYCLDETNTIYSIEPFDDRKNVIQKTGAGDAYATGFVASHLLGNPTQDSMKWGALNAHSVMEHLGAQDGLLKRGNINKLAIEHKDFHANKLT